jgi:hypothetical protein
MSAELAAGVLAVACLVFLWVLSKRDKFPLSWLAKTILAAFAGAGIAATSIGAWIAGWVGWLADLIGGIPGWFGFSLVIPGVILSSIVTVVLVFFAVYGWRRSGRSRVRSATTSPRRCVRPVAAPSAG